MSVGCKLNGATIQQLLQHVVILVSIVCRLWRPIPGGATAKGQLASNPRNGPFRPTAAGESEVATVEAQGREEAQQGTPESQQIVAVGVKQGRDGDLARVYIECSGEGIPAGRTEGVQPCGSQHHETLRAAELCAKAVSEGRECRWGGMLVECKRSNAGRATEGRG